MNPRDTLRLTMSPPPAFSSLAQAVHTPPPSLQLNSDSFRLFLHTPLSTAHLLPSFPPGAPALTITPTPALMRRRAKPLSEKSEEIQLRGTFEWRPGRAWRLLSFITCTNGTGPELTGVRTGRPTHKLLAGTFHEQCDVENRSCGHSPNTLYGLSTVSAVFVGGDCAW